MSWQPIETAPRDGTIIDVWYVHTNGEGGRYPDVHWMDGEWQDQYEYAVNIEDLRAVTHWTPLLPAPE